MKFFSAVVIAATVIGSAQAGADPSAENWRYYGGDFANTHYSTLDQINAENFSDVSIAWRWKSIETEVMENNRGVTSSQFKPTPLVVDGVMYLPTSFCQVVALDAGSGELIWQFDPESYKAGRPANLGFQHRGLSYWTSGEEERLFIAVHDRKLWAIDPKTGTPCEDFGDSGVVDLATSLGRNFNPRMMTHSSPVGICNDTVIVGSIVFDGPTLKEMPPGHVRAFDVRTGEMKWIFHTIPQEGEFGNETWEDGSWKYSGNTNVWSMFSTDEELNRIYLPVSTATNDMYGGHRLGDNLFAESIVCLDADSGERIWHFQAVHHGMWDYDFPTSPNLMDIVIDGKPRKILAQVSKQAFAYVLDRVTGEPIWPIEECDVPPSTVPGERAAPTQPIPTKPAAFDRQGFSDDDVIDFTPELRAEALKLLEGFPRGPLFTPPTEKGTLGLPSAGGGANWPGAAFDPETGIMYVPSSTTLAAFTITKPDPSRSNLDYVTGWMSAGPPRGVKGLPIVKPPYSRITAIDLKTGDHVWMTPHGDGPIDNPALEGLDVGPLGASGSGNGPLLTKSLLFVTQGAAYLGTENDKQPKITVFDKKTGKILGRIPLPADPYGNPMTYTHEGKQYIAVAVGGGGFMGGKGKYPAEIIALSL
jgi:quinoprotein glucose dehydrogenase